MSDTSVVVTKNFGATRVAEFGAGADPLEHLVVEEYVDELNAIGTATLTVPTRSLKATHFMPRGATDEPREVEIWRDGVKVWCGPIMATEAAGPLMRVHCDSLERYLADRLFGPVSTQTLVNGGFETGDTTGWAEVGLDQFDIVEGSPSRQRGSWHARLETATPADETYIEQVVDVDLSAITEGAMREYKASIWYHWRHPSAAVEDPPASGIFVPTCQPAILERGLFVRVENPIGTVYEDHVDPITRNDLPNVRRPVTRDDVRKRVTAELPTGSTSRIRFRAYCPALILVDVDEASLTWEQVIGCAVGEAAIDYGLLVERIFDHAMDRDSNTPDLSYVGATVGTTTDRHWLESSNANIFDAIVDMTRDGLFDIAVTPDRTLRIYAPTKGALRSEMVLEQGKNLVDGTAWANNGRQSLTVVRGLGQGDGSDRETAIAVETGSHGGLYIEGTETLPTEAPLLTIDSRTEAVLHAKKASVRTPTFTILDSTIANYVTVGDRLPHRAYYGAVLEETSIVRVIKRTVTPRAGVDDVRLTVQPA